MKSNGKEDSRSLRGTRRQVSTYGIPTCITVLLLSIKITALCSNTNQTLAADIVLSVHLENIIQKRNQVYLPRRNHLKAASTLFSTVQRYQPEL